MAKGQGMKVHVAPNMNRLVPGVNHVNNVPHVVNVIEDAKKRASAIIKEAQRKKAASIVANAQKIASMILARKN